MTTPTWYEDLADMAEDDACLQRVYAALRRDLSDEARTRTRLVHVYPSRVCSYTIGKERVFIKVRDDKGGFLPDCVLRHVLLHELAHTLNVTHGHDTSFRSWMRWLTQDGRVPACADRVPVDYNTCH